eukprot:TRINITY_DN63223_c0_g1_i1.p1 TRINITY_DN63223_c0_g1~~TRINITY_DN63223_c0_g1_i1.p1  ORF type:complete len:883 (-),score=91.75 TRINITY_DN63223_c0_g1_i1:136-2784(-)
MTGPGSELEMEDRSSTATVSFSDNAMGRSPTSPTGRHSFQQALRHDRSGARSFDLDLERTPVRLGGLYGLPVAAPDLVGDREEAAQSDIAQQQIGNYGILNWWKTCFAGRFDVVLVIIFTAAEAARTIVSAAALDGNALNSSQALVVAQGAVSLVIGLLCSLVFDGLEGLRKALNPWQILRCMPVAIGFSLSQSALAFAMSKGLAAATVMVLGYLYMPLCALLSRWVFKRNYGWLEVHALVFLTLSVMIFLELHVRHLELERNGRAVIWNLASIAFSCASAIFTERVLKPKYSPRNLARPFHIQKVWLETGQLLPSILVLLTVDMVGEPSHRPIYKHDMSLLAQAFTGLMGVAVAVRVLQSWLAGLISKHLSTTARSVIQSVAVIVVYVEAVTSGHEESSITTWLLAVIIVLSGVMYQAGRKMTCQPPASDESMIPADLAPESEDGVLVPGFTRGRAHSDPAGARVISASAISAASPHLRHHKLVKFTFLQSFGAPFRSDDHFLAPCEFSPDEVASASSAQEQRSSVLEQMRTAIPDPAWLQQVKRANAKLARWLSSYKGLSTQILCVVSFVLADATRTLVYAWSISGTPIVSQSLVVAMSAVSIPIGILFSAAIDGRAGVIAAVSLRNSLVCLPVAACFSVGQSLQIKAYGAGISASVNTVLGYFYMPLSALLSRWVFQRAYGSLEWLALLLLSLSAVVFCLLRSSRSEGESTSILAMCYCLGSVVISCIASLMCEKIMKERSSPFYTQKVHLEFGGLLTACAMLFVVGFASSHVEDAFWKERDVGRGVYKAGVFVGWTFKTFAALAATTVQSWLGGLVSKQLSTVVRSVAQCLSLLIIYFFGDLVLKQLAFDWIVGAAAIVVALSVQVFTLAGQRRKETR